MAALVFSTYAAFHSIPFHSITMSLPFANDEVEVVLPVGLWVIHTPFSEDAEGRAILVRNGVILGNCVTTSEMRNLKESWFINVGKRGRKRGDDYWFYMKKDDKGEVKRTLVKYNKGYDSGEETVLKSVRYVQIEAE